MKIIILTLYDKYELEYNSIISTDKIIEQLADIEKINKQYVVLLYNNIVIKYQINEQKINNDITFFMIIAPTKV
jgi:hypothetical protein